MYCSRTLRSYSGLISNISLLCVSCLTTALLSALEKIIKLTLIYNCFCSDCAETILEAKHASVQQYELEQRNLIAKNQKLERQVQEMRELIGRNAEEGSRVQNMLSAVTEAVTKRRSVGPGGSQSDTITSKEGDKKQLEASMKKVRVSTPHKLTWASVFLRLVNKFQQLLVAFSICNLHQCPI